jgi:aldehyde:ferredoxin oxidoreductase
VPQGYVGTILRVDLTSGSITKEGLPDESVLRKYVGGTGLGAKILNDEISLDTKPFDPDNRLIFMTGVLTGTTFPCSSDLSLVTLNGNLGYVIGNSHTHGFFGAFLKFAGYDGIIVQGASKTPVFLWIHDKDVELRDASDVWGKDTHESETFIKAKVGWDRVTVAAIGPGGENMIHGASIENDYHHLLAKCGVGSIMGSKKLKAIAVKGTGGVKLKSPVEFQKIVKQWYELAFANGQAPLLSRAGVTRFYEFMVGVQDWTAHKNMLSPREGHAWTKEMVEGWKQFKITPVACWACPIACTYKSEITYGPHKGYAVTLAGGGENQEGAAGIVGVKDPGTVMYMTDLNDRMGVDSSDIGICMGLAFELYERGLLTKEQTDGLELNWGNAEAAEALFRKIINREGFGKIFAEGPKKAAQIIGGDAYKYVLHVKGSGFNMHDWRSAWGILLGQITAGAGGCWQGSYAADLIPEPDLGYNDRNPVFETKGLGQVVARSSMKRLWDDCFGQCTIGNLQEIPGGGLLAPKAVAAATGWKDFSFDEALTVGQRVATLERIFNMKRGLTIENDMDVGPRLVEPATEGRAKDMDIRPHLKGLIQDFYEAMGWERETGKPLPETLKKLDLEEEAKGL